MTNVITMRALDLRPGMRLYEEWGIGDKVMGYTPVGRIDAIRYTPKDRQAGLHVWVDLGTGPAYLFDRDDEVVAEEVV